MPEMKKVSVETMIPSNFKWIARDHNGSVFAFESKPNLDYGTNKNPAPCDMWDVYEGEVLRLTAKTPIKAPYLFEELGDWRNSLVELE